MKVRTILLVIMVAIVAGGCAAITPPMRETPAPTIWMSPAVATPTAGFSPRPTGAPNYPLTLVPTSNSQVTPTPRSGNDCSVPVEFVIGETTMDQVAALWGDPDRIAVVTEPYAGWFYRDVAPGGVEVRFHQGTVDRLYFWPVNCTLGDVVAIRGEPEVVEVFWADPAVRRIGPPVIPLKIFHYPRQGLLFYVLVDSQEALTHHRTTDSISTRILESPGTLEDLLACCSARLVNWSGFDK